MSLFLRVETRSRLLGSKDYDKVLIAVSQIHKIESTGGEKGCVITHGTPSEQTVCERDIGPLLSSSVINLSFKSK
jgi:hypothetical protein